MNIKGLIMLLLTVLLLGACADPNQYRGRDSLVNLAYSCPTCGATVSDNYFAGSAYKAMGPGSY